MINGATGTTGQIAVQIAKHLGAGRVIATGRNPDALATLRELGADDTIDLTADADALQDALAAQFADGGVDIVLDYLSSSPTEVVLGAIAKSHRVAKLIRYVIAGGAAGASTTVPTSVLGSTSLVPMGSGIGAVRIPDIVQSATDAVQIAASANLQIDLTERPLAHIEHTWATNSDRSRIVFTVEP
ncbi:MAG: zinc-binding dehydrogenase [Microbacteriaceae bacterium]